MLKKFKETLEMLNYVLLEAYIMHVVVYVRVSSLIVARCMLGDAASAGEMSLEMRHVPPGSQDKKIKKLTGGVSPYTSPAFPISWVCDTTDYFK